MLESDKIRFKISEIKPKKNQGIRISILGRTGSGKSAFLAYIFDYLQKQNLCVIVDTKNQYKNIPALTAEALTKATKGLYRIYELDLGNGVIVSDLERICEWVCFKMFERKNCTIIIEECGAVIRKSGILYKTMPNFAKCLNQGRSENVSVICVSQRPAQIHTDVLAQSDHIICFSLTSERDREAIRNYFEVDDLALLNNYEFLWYNIPAGKKNVCYKLYKRELSSYLKYDTNR